MQQQREKDNRGSSKKKKLIASQDISAQLNQNNILQNDSQYALDYQTFPKMQNKSKNKKKKSANGKDINQFNQPQAALKNYSSEKSDFECESKEENVLLRDSHQNIVQVESTNQLSTKQSFSSVNYKSPSLEALEKLSKKALKKLGKEQKVKPIEQSDESFSLIIREIDVLKCIFEDQMKIIIPHSKKTMGQIQIDLFQSRIPENLRTIIRFKYTYTFEYPFTPVHFVVEPKQNIPDRIDATKFRNQLIEDIKKIAKKQQERMEESVFSICTMILDFVKEFDEEWIQQHQDKIQQQIQMYKNPSTIIEDQEENADTVNTLPQNNKQTDLSQADNSMSKNKSSLDQLQSYAIKKSFVYEYQDKLLGDFREEVNLSKESFDSTDQDQQEEKVLENLKSAYRTNFEEIDQIGKGGFGQVYKVKNRLDSLNYAVKKIKLDINQKELTKKTLKEVNFLSRLQHNHIVRYYQAWLEKPDEKTLQEFDNSDEEDEVREDSKEEESSSENDSAASKASKESSMCFEFIESSEEESSLPFEYENYSDNGIVFEDSSGDEEQKQKQENNTSHDHKIEPHKNKENQVQDIDETDFFSKDKKKHQKKKKKKDFRILHIQMEFCGGSTLREMIDNHFFCAEKEKRISSKQKKSLLAQILEALKYLHEKELIHRDLKPQNILLDKNGQIKLVDFGLATTLKKERQIERKAVLNLKRASSVQSNLYNLSSFPGDSDFKDKKSENSNNFFPSEVTRGVGTGVYRAPEQENTSSYCTKADMYSLGIIIFEMWYPLPTFMEKYQTLKEIREKNQLPSDFDLKVGKDGKEIRDILSKLLDPDPNKRYSAEELLKTLEDEQYLEHLGQITNPTNSDHRKLIEYLFKVQNLPSAIYTVEPYIKIMRFSQSYQLIQDRIKSVFEAHGGINLDANPLIPLTENIYLNKLYLNTKQSRLQFRVKMYHNIIKRQYKSIMLANTGTLIEYSDNLLTPWIQQVKTRHYIQMKKLDKRNNLLQKELSSMIKRYTFATTQFQDSEKKKFYPVENKRASFDIVYIKDEEYQSQDISSVRQYYEANLIRVAYEVIRMFCKDTTKYKIRIGFSGLLDMMISSLAVQEETLLKILADKSIMEIIQNLRENDFRQSAELEQVFINQYGIQKEIFQQIISFYKISSSDLETFKECLEERFIKYQNEINLIYQYLLELTQYLELFKIPKETLQFDTCLLPDNLMYHSGLIFDIINYEELEFIKKRSNKLKEINTNQEANIHAKIFIKGGRYDHFFVESQKQQQQAPEGIGFQVYVDELFNHFFRPILSQFENQEAQIQQQLQDYNEIEAIIISTDEDLNEEKFILADELWNHQIKAHVIIEPVQALFRILETLKKQKIKFLITVKKKKALNQNTGQKTKYKLQSLAQLNQKNNDKEREYEINEIIEIIYKAKYYPKQKYLY
ncbi:hypothetical protein ABPG74_022865 [Tetrahymena malaccensis]